MLIEIKKDKVYEYQEENTEKGVSFLCGFKHDGAFIEKAEQKSSFDNPVPEYIKLIGKKEHETTDMCEDISTYLNELKEAKKTA